MSNKDNKDLVKFIKTITKANLLPWQIKMISHFRQQGKTRMRNYSRKCWIGFDPSKDYLIENGMTADEFTVDELRQYKNTWQPPVDEFIDHKPFDQNQIAKCLGVDISYSPYCNPKWIGGYHGWCLNRHPTANSSIWLYLKDNEELISSTILEF